VQGKSDQIDVDIRFLLANERTLLAWIRTSLAIQAGGLALALTNKHHPYFGIIILLLGACTALIGYHRFIVADRSIRQHHLPPSGNGPTIQVAGIVMVAIGLAAVQLTMLR
jgi:putative membrane protein